MHEHFLCKKVTRKLPNLRYYRNVVVIGSDWMIEAVNLSTLITLIHERMLNYKLDHVIKSSPFLAINFVVLCHCQS